MLLGLLFWGLLLPPPGLLGLSAPPPVSQKERRGLLPKKEPQLKALLGRLVNESDVLPLPLPPPPPPPPPPLPPLPPPPLPLTGSVVVVPQLQRRLAGEAPDGPAADGAADTGAEGPIRPANAPCALHRRPPSSTRTPLPRRCRAPPAVAAGALPPPSARCTSSERAPSTAFAVIATDATDLRRPLWPATACAATGV